VGGAARHGNTIEGSGRKVNKGKDKKAEMKETAQQEGIKSEEQAMRAKG